MCVHISLDTELKNRVVRVQKMKCKVFLFIFCSKFIRTQIVSILQLNIMGLFYLYFYGYIVI